MAYAFMLLTDNPDLIERLENVRDALNVEERHGADVGDAQNREERRAIENRNQIANLFGSIAGTV